MAKITKREIAALITELKSNPSYRAYMLASDPDNYNNEGERRGLQLTVACNDEQTEWSWQSGDNSYTGGAYSFPHWAVVEIFARDKVSDIVNDIFSQWAELIDS